MPDTLWMVIYNSKHYERYKRVLQETTTELEEMRRPAGTAVTYRWQHLGDPCSFPCLVKTHAFKVDKKITTPGKVHAVQKFYHHIVYPRDAKLLLEAAMRPHEPEPDDRPTPRL